MKNIEHIPCLPAPLNGPAISALGKVREPSKKESSMLKYMDSLRVLRKQSLKTKQHFFAQPEAEQTMLLARKKKLRKECAKLDQQIQNKQQALNLLHNAVSQSMMEYQSISAGKLAAGLAHEIRNPLTTIKGFIQLLKPELSSIRTVELAEVALDEISRANDLLSEFLTLVKPGYSAKHMVCVNNLIRSMEKLFASEALLKQIGLEMRVPDEDLYILAEEKQLKQVLINLLKNAFEAIVEASPRQRGEISVLLLRQNEYVEISVRDNGIGIDEFSFEKLFTPFYTTKEKGTGIGLSISKQIIESHGGKMQVESERGVGTIFTVLLPMV